MIRRTGALRLHSFQAAWFVAAGLLLLLLHLVQPDYVVLADSCGGYR